MNGISKQSVCVGILAMIGWSSFAQSDKRLIAMRPATHFTESFPLGNGRLGAMVFGNPDQERIVLNEISMWSGSVQDADKKEAYVHLPAIRRLLLAGKNKEAQQLLQQHFVCAGNGSGYGAGADVPFGCYQTLGDLRIDWHDLANKATAYQRTLDLDSAITTSRWIKNDVQFQQQVFVSAPAKSIVVRLTADHGGALNFTTSLFRRKDVNYDTLPSGLQMKGSLPGGNGMEGIRYAGQLLVQSFGGTKVHTKEGVRVEGADSCLLYFSAVTDMNWPNVHTRGKDPVGVVGQQQSMIASRSFQSLLREHINDYQRLFNRCSISLGQPVDDHVDIESRLARFREGQEDPSLISLYFNFGRYLLISSSRPGGMPANLQGLWAEEYQTPWNGDYHLNVNLQMNYWPATVTNLADCQEPLFRYIRQLSKAGRSTAAAYYNARGWVAHVISNPWGFTAPGEGADWGSTLTGGAWLATHIIEAYAYNPDKAFLKDYYEPLKAAAQFFTDILIREPTNGFMVTAPSNSPENSFKLPGGGTAATCMGPAMDMQIGRQLLLGTAFVANELGRDRKWADSLRMIAAKLAPVRISPRTGGIMEWLDDYEEAEPHHRHVSQLYGLYPYHEITPWRTPELAWAARRTLTRRGDGGTGWSRAWKIAFYARLGDGDHALTMLKALLNPVTIRKDGAGTYPNLFDAHPPFQIDGNFGATAAIAEFFIQSHGENSVIRMLPALPKHRQFSKGAVRGMRARNGFEVDLKWQNFELTETKLKSLNGKVCRIAFDKQPASVVSAGKATRFTFKNGIVSFPTKAGSTYTIVPPK